VGPVCSSCGVSKTDFVNSGSYLRTVFVLISGITTFVGLAGGGAGFLTSGLIDTGGGGGITAFFTSSLGAGLVAATAGGGEAGCGFEMGFEILDTVDFLAGAITGFLAGAGGATFLGATTGLAGLLATGAFLIALPAPDEWTGFAAAFLAGAIFLPLGVGFLAGFAAFFLVAIQLGFF